MQLTLQNSANSMKYPSRKNSNAEFAFVTLDCNETYFKAAYPFTGYVTGNTDNH